MLKKKFTSSKAEPALLVSLNAKALFYMVSFDTQMGQDGTERDRTGRDRTGQNRGSVLCLVRTGQKGTVIPFCI